MTDTKHPADVLAATLETAWLWHATPTFCAHVAAMLRALPALEAERNALRAELAALKAQAAQPLTDEQALCVIDDLPEVDIPDAVALDIVRATERAHGIGKEGGAA